MPQHNSRTPTPEQPRYNSRKGVPNRKKVEFRASLQSYCDSINLDPFGRMADLANDPDADLSLRFLALKELCQYLQPKLRAVVLSGDADNPVSVAYQIKSTLNEALERAYGDGVRAAANGQGHPVLPMRRS